MDETAPTGGRAETFADGYESQTLPDMFRQWGAFLRRRFREVLICMLVGGVLGAVLVSRMELLYEGEVLLMVEPPARSPLETEASAAAAIDAFVEGQVYIIQSTQVLTDVVDRADLTSQPFFQSEPKGWLEERIEEALAVFATSPELRAEDAALLDRLDPVTAHAVRTLRDNLYVNREGDTGIISIRAIANDPDLAARIANTIGTSFVANREASQFQQASRVAGWLDERAIELQLQLSQAEDAVASFRIDNNLVSGEPGITLSEQRLTELNSELINTRAALAERRAVYSRATEVVSSGGTTESLPEMQGSEIFATLRALLLELERRETALGGPSTTNSRMTALRDERAAIQRQLTDEVQRILDLIANEIETLEVREQLIVDALTQAGGETGEASRSSVEMRELERRAAAYGALYERYLNNAGLVDESITYLISGVEVIDPANAPLEARFPTPKAVIIFFLALGATVGIGIGYGRESMQPGFLTARQIQRTLGRPVLASIPMLPPRDSAWDMVRDLPMSPYAEAVRLLRHELSSRDSVSGAPVLLLTSAVPGEGKTSLASALATSASSAGLNVLLIDADLRRGGTTRLFGAEQDEGLTEVMRTRTYAFHDLAPGAGELDLLPTGAPVTSPTDLFAGGNLPRYLSEARKAYDLIVIDGPPVANMADAPLLARLSDSVAFVVRWKDTPRDVVQEALTRLGGDTGKVGLTLNAVDLDVVAQYGETYGQYVLASQQPNGRGVSV
ncbi:GumC family protein [Lacimonas salitolerans]|uniref:non-specific protein-tyrosine kinase n=1 Tax=Lacimonas salitolerans TaxID=1323750 RepID=A0ABW4EL72_9RHOB